MKLSDKTLYIFVPIMAFIIGVIGAIFCVPKIQYFFSRPMVSVVMPVYNRVGMVGTAIQSVLNQTFQDFELVIADDGSTDGTAHILKMWAKKDPRIRIVSLEKNSGVAMARNAAQDAARGKYLAIMDSDDAMLPRRLEKSVDVMERYPQYTVINGGLRWIENSFFKKEIQESNRGERKNYTFNQNEDPFPICMFFMNCFVNVSSMVRRDFVVKNNIRYNPAYEIGEDYDYWMQIIFAGGRLAHLSDVLVNVRKKHRHLMSSNRRVYKDTLAIKQSFLDKFQSDIPAQWDYSLPERCDMIASFLPKNDKDALVDKEMLHRYLERNCAIDIPSEKKVFVEHPAWKDVIVFEDDKNAYRSSNKDAAEYVRKKDSITLKWKKWKRAETFVFDPQKKEYILKE